MKKEPTTKTQPRQTAKTDQHEQSQQTDQSLSHDVATSRHASRYLIIGITLAIFNFGFYTILANLIFKNSNLLWLSSLISTLVSTILAYILHSKITWKERQPTKTGVLNFFIWNALLAVVFSPSLTWFFGLFTPLYEFALQISEILHLPFNFDFIESTGVFILVNIVTMILNYFFYDRLVFNQKKDKKKDAKENKIHEPKN